MEQVKIGDRVWADYSGEQDWEPGEIVKMSTKFIGVEFDSEPGELYKLPREQVRPIKRVTITRDNVAIVHEGLKEGITELLAAYGLELPSKGFSLRYTGSSVRFSVEGVGLSADAPKNMDVGKSQFEKNCHRFGIPPEAYGMKFKQGEETFQVVEIAPKSRKYPVVCKGPNDKRWKFSATRILIEYSAQQDQKAYEKAGKVLSSGESS